MQVVQLLEECEMTGPQAFLIRATAYMGSTGHIPNPVALADVFVCSPWSPVLDRRKVFTVTYEMCV